ncbi:MAG: peptidylprolyl isomerase [Myxococcota bacterium]
MSSIKNLSLLLPGLLATSIVVGCNQKGPPPPVAELVSMNDAEATPLRIELSDYRMAVARLRFTRADSLYAKPLPEELKTYVLERMIDDALLFREADRLGVRASTLSVSREMAVLRSSMPAPRFQRILVDTYQTEKNLEAAITRNLTALTVLERLTMDSAKVTEAEVMSAWEALPPSRKVRPERIHAAQILVSTEAEATKIWRTLRRRGNFAKLAKKHSESPEAVDGGDLGWFSRGELPAVFDEMCFPLKKRFFSHVTASEYGYHICRVLDREKERPYSLNELRPELELEIKTDKVRRARQQVMERLRATVKIVKNKRAIAQVL